jgi:Tol biopolymer transport system component
MFRLASDAALDTNRKEHTMRRSFNRVALARATVMFSIAALAATASAGQAAFPGETGRIVFMSNRTGNFDIYTVKQNGQAVVQLTTHPAADQFPSWSADGMKIAFTSLRDGNGEIYVMNADGSSQERVTDNSFYDEGPVFSPDGTKIAFASTRDAPIACPSTFRNAACTPYTEVYVMNADGSNVTRLTNNSSLDLFPMFSPDGTKIAFTSGRDGNTEIYVMNTDGSEQTRITDRPGGDSQPSWSPDGGRIAWRSSPVATPEIGDIWVMNANGTEATQLTDDPADDLRPTWSPSGTKIAFRSLRIPNGDIYRMKADGSKEQPITLDPAQDAYPDWQPLAAELDD